MHQLIIDCHPLTLHILLDYCEVVFAHVRCRVVRARHYQTHQGRGIVNLLHPGLCENELPQI